jgi:hypothetical protein
MGLAWLVSQSPMNAQQVGRADALMAIDRCPWRGSPMCSAAALPSNRLSHWGFPAFASAHA